MAKISNMKLHLLVCVTYKFPLYEGASFNVDLKDGGFCHGCEKYRSGTR